MKKDGMIELISHCEISVKNMDGSYNAFGNLNIEEPVCLYTHYFNDANTCVDEDNSVEEDINIVVPKDIVKYTLDR